MAKTYKELEAALAEILERVEHGSYEELDQLLKDYDSGTKLIEQLQKKLDDAKNTITKVQSS